MTRFLHHDQGLPHLARSPGIRWGKNRSGFTLMEMVIVMLIMGIMAAVAVPKFSDSLCRFRVEATARRIAADLTLASQCAEAKETDQQVDFSLPSNFYSLQGYIDPDHSSIAYQVYLSKTGHPAKLVSCDFGGDCFVMFDMYGKPQSGGTVVVQSGSYQKTVNVNATTGRVTIE